jgi:hypothetical protein
VSFVLPELDERDREEQRYVLYSVNPRTREQRELCAGSLEAVGLMFRTMREDGDTTHDSRLGLRDRVEGIWLANPYGKGDA